MAFIKVHIDMDFIFILHKIQYVNVATVMWV